MFWCEHHRQSPIAMSDNDAPDDLRLQQIPRALTLQFHGISIPVYTNVRNWWINPEQPINHSKLTFSTGVKYSATPNAVPFTELYTLCIIGNFSSYCFESKPYLALVDFFSLLKNLISHSVQLN